jgi:hypothetical protein
MSPALPPGHLNSGAGISITNGLQTVEREMEATSIVRATEFDLFGCLDVSTDDRFTFTPATAGTFFDGGANDQLLAIKTSHCEGWKVVLFSSLVVVYCINTVEWSGISSLLYLLKFCIGN